jgi:dephospho-CoA kinase
VLPVASQPYKIGITGTIASGKSLVGRILKQHRVPVLDTDEVVADLYRQDKDLKQALVQAFSAKILTRAGNISKTTLRKLVFRQEEKLKLLESLVHPRVAQKVDDFLQDRSFKSPFRAVLAPKLFEAKTEGRYDEVWAVVVRPQSVLEDRLMARNNISRDEAKLRISRQWSQDEKARLATRVIDNSGAPEQTRHQVASILKELRKVRGQ